MSWPAEPPGTWGLQSGAEGKHLLENCAAMKAFVQMLRYIWPQWPRIIVVVLSAMAIAAMLSLSFVTIIPLLKVMIGSEGLHGWVDRKVCEHYYGLEFTDRPDLMVSRVAKDSLAEEVGIQAGDYVVDVSDLRRQDPNTSYLRLLQELAGTQQEIVNVALKRPPGGSSESLTVPMQLLTVAMRTPNDPEYAQRLEGNSFQQFRRQVGVRAARGGEWLASLLPRAQTAENKVKAVFLIVLAIGVTTVIRCIAKYFQDYLGQKIVEVGANHLREDVFERLTRMPVSVFANEKPSDLISRIVSDTVTMGAALRVLLGKALREPMNALFMLGVALYINWHLTLVFLASGPLVVALFGTFGSKMRKATRRSLVARAQMLAKLQEAVAGLRVIKIYNQEQHEQRAFKEINNRLLHQLLNMSKVDAVTQPVLEVLGMFAGCAALVVGMGWVAREHLDGAEFLALLILMGAAAEAVRKASDIWTKIQQSNAAAERVFAILQQPVEYEKPGAVVLPPVRRSIEFQDVVFSYPGAQRPALNGVNLVVTAGQNVAIVGPNGSGKTTLASLLPRFHDPDTGRVLIDGQDIREVSLQSLRSQIGMVTQQVISFNETVAANIGYGRPGATHDEIVAAAQRAYAHEFITRLPKGYETMIGEQGVGLSGGQLQRIVIARAIVKNPAILIFDEATSQIDADSEARIHEAIEEIMQGRTTFIIAHRFSTVIAADVIVVMHEGRIIARGQHEELMRTCPVYQALYETQLIKP
ncbi:MAG: ABC transporter transmembrane domain-containing protein [Planctomycetes bacterium]|nr:ABC transporter transmembrane domain-containing protein [Planctomycetota bacterium]